MKKKTVLILCTGNSCRSQIAEAIINDRKSNWQAYSAGAQPSGYVHPKAIKALAEINIAHRGVSKSIEDLPPLEFDVVMTVCTDAEKNCPVWLSKGHKIHIGFPDPAKAKGTEEEIMDDFRKVLKAIETKILAYLHSIE